MDPLAISLVTGFAILVAAIAIARLFRGTVKRQMPGNRNDGGSVGFVGDGRNHADRDHGDSGGSDGGGGGGGGGD